MLFNSYSYEILYKQFHWIYLQEDIKLFLVTVDNRLIFEIEIVKSFTTYCVILYIASWKSKIHRHPDDKELNQARAKPDQVDQPVRNARNIVHRPNKTQNAWLTACAPCHNKFMFAICSSEFSTTKLNGGRYLPCRSSFQFPRRTTVVVQSRQSSVQLWCLHAVNACTNTQQRISHQPPNLYLLIRLDLRQL